MADKMANQPEHKSQVGEEEEEIPASTIGRSHVGDKFPAGHSDPGEEGQDDEDGDDNSDEELGRGKRTRVPTEKALENYKRDVMKRFFKECGEVRKQVASEESTLAGYTTLEELKSIKKRMQDKWEAFVALANELTDLALAECVNKKVEDSMESARKDMDGVLAAVELRRKVAEEEDKISVFSHHTGRSSRSRHSHASSRRSSASSKALDAEARAAALKAQLEAQEIEDLWQEQVKELEAQEAKRKADAEAALDKHKRELERIKVQKLLKMEEAKAKVYRDDEDRQSVRSTRSSVRSKSKKPEGQVSPILTLDEPHSQGSSNKLSDVGALAEAISASIGLSRLPVPEPPIFTGNPLEYNDWVISFRTLVEEKYIPPKDKIHYLKRYLGGPAKEAVSSYFLLGSETAYDEARALLEDRYGNLFLVTEAFRDKLESWPKIPARDGKSLRAFSDFLRQCKTAMTHLADLRILDDSRENKKLLQKLPDWVVTRWSRIVAKSRKDCKFPSFADFSDFIAEEARIACDPVTSFEALKIAPPKEKGDKEKEKVTPPKDKKRAPAARTFASESESKEIKCSFCKKLGHVLSDCRTFTAKPSDEKVDFVKTSGLCFGCLQHGHLSKNCPQKDTCKKCTKKHPTSLHMEPRVYQETAAKSETKEQPKTAAKETKEPPKETKEPPKEQKPAVCRKVFRGKAESASSMIVPVWVSTQIEPEKEYLVYALLDTPSDTTFILDQTAKDLNAQAVDVALKLTTMTSRDELIHCKKYSDIVVRGFDLDTRIHLPSVYSRDFIPVNKSHIPTAETAKKWPHLASLSDKVPPLQDCDIGLLIGYNCPQALAPRGCITGEDNQPFAIQTVLGWSVVGCIDAVEDSGDIIGLSHKVITTRVPEELRLPGQTQEISFVGHNTVKEVLSPGRVIETFEKDFNDHQLDINAYSEEDRRFLDKMTDSIHQRDDGHYEMPLPFKGERPLLHSNKDAAMCRLNHLKRKFLRDDKYRKDYVHFMDDILEKGDAEKVPPSDCTNESVWYIPHHGVYHPKKPDKIRVVFDCSAKYKGVSLNDDLLTGPDLTNSLAGVLCRFRQEPVALMCDVERMFHQFYVDPQDRDYFRFLWFEGGDLNSDPVEYRMKVHLFGAASSPGCANFGLKNIANENESEFGKEAADFVRQNFYVDDGLKSVETAQDAIALVDNARKMCAKAGLRLHKFVSNNHEVTESIPKSERAKNVKGQDLSFEDLPVERALGIEWSIESDDFQFRLVLKDRPLTRRGVLSTVASHFDPIGFLAPYVLVGKQILQEMCRDGADWDDPLPEPLCQKWERWRQDLPQLASTKIPRCYKPEGFGKVVSAELHHFSDASMTGYGQCSYLRLVDEHGKVHCSLVMGKARVTPLKITTIPRLELTAAVVSLRVSAMLRQELDEKDIKEFFWTDSKVVLGYISNDARRFHVFVANRVQQIRDRTTPDQWRYVRSEENPADHASRGLSAKELTVSNWFQGPSFLWEREIPDEDGVKELSPDDPEVKTVHVKTTQVETKNLLLDRIDRFSDWSRATRAVAVLRRVITRKRQEGESTQSVTSPDERQKVEIAIIQMLQRQVFRKEIKSLKKPPTDVKGETSETSPLHKLDPFLDEEGTLRVGGRLKQSSLLYGVKHPIILPQKSHVTTLIVKHFHEKAKHQGKGITMNEIRSNGFWIVSCGKAVSAHIFHCVTCRRLRSRTTEQKMADLPDDRTEPSPPFTYCGMDCFGPFYVKEGRKECKRYGLLFTCMSSRAVHIEMLDDMTTDAFINALRCFIALRGAVRQLRSDQGSNFVGAQHELKEALKEIKHERLQTYFAEQGCDFVMNVPHASHMGGVWERQIRTIRSVLNAILHQSGGRLDSASLRTFFYEAMAIVNGRPLTVDNLGDPCGPEPLTPNHLLTMKSKVILPPPGDFVKEDVYARKRWRRVQYLANEFWARWRKE